MPRVRLSIAVRRVELICAATTEKPPSDVGAALATGRAPRPPDAAASERAIDVERATTRSILIERPRGPARRVGMGELEEAADVTMAGAPV